jgi:hypothetical protein
MAGAAYRYLEYPALKAAFGNLAMIPFLKRKDEASISAPADKIQRKPDEEPEFDTLEAAGQDLIDAIHSKDAKAVAAALRAAFELADSEPHTEGEHI